MYSFGLASFGYKNMLFCFSGLQRYPQETPYENDEAGPRPRVHAIMMDFMIRGR